MKDDQLHISDSKKDVQSELDERFIELTSLFEVTKTLDASLDLKAILDHILLTAMGKLLVTKGLILLKRDGQDFKVETSRGVRQKEIDAFTLTIDAPPPKPFLIVDSEERANWISAVAGIGMALVLPMRVGETTIGLVCFGGKSKGLEYQQADVDFLTSLINIASTSIHNGLIVEQLRIVNRRLDRKIQELNTLFDIGKEFNTTLNPQKILQLLTYAILGQMAVQQCLVLVFEGSSIQYSIAQGIKGASVGRDDERLIKRLTHISEPTVIRKQKELEKLKEWKLSVLVPMRHQGQTRGIIGLGKRMFEDSYTPDELEFLSTLANQAMIAIENAHLFEETLEKERLEEELSIASRIQQRLLPKSIPQVEGFELTGLNIPSKQVGGDYYDFIPIDHDRIAIAIADVSGKGAPAALLMANLQASLRTLVGEDKPIGEIIGKVNNLIVENTDIDKFITAFYGVLDIKTGAFAYSNAGHNPPLLVHADGSIDLLDKGGLVLGMMKNVPFEEETVQLQPDDRIVMYTDGVTEAMDAHEEEYGEERLLQAIKDHSALRIEALGREIVSQIQSFSAGDQQQDDITLVIIQRKAS
jgi:sigma-B regulation protein RsbU (phosphoserine phosphatase)